MTTEKDSPPPRLEPTPPPCTTPGAPLFSKHPAPRVPPGASLADRGAGLCLGGAGGKQTAERVEAGRAASQKAACLCRRGIRGYGLGTPRKCSEQRCVLAHSHLNHPAPPSQEAAKQGPEPLTLLPGDLSACHSSLNAHSIPWGTRGGVLPSHVLTVGRRASS